MKSKTTKTIRNIIKTILPITLLTFPCISMVQAGAPWEQIHKLLATDGAAGDFFGASVAITGNLAVIGAALSDNNNGINSGAAYVFDANTGQQLFKLTASDGAAHDQFGYSVAITSNLAVIGARYDDDNGDASGSAYIFDVNTGRQLFKLLPSDGAENNWFGWSVAMNGNLAVIGANKGGDASGSAYVFDVNTGKQLFKLLASDGVAGDSFGYSVAITGNLALVGAIGDDDNDISSGSAYIFDVTTGKQLFKLLPSDGAANDNFGYSVDINGNLAVIGALLGNNDNGTETGAAYVFDVTTGQQLFKLLASDGVANDWFGNSVALDNNLAVIGAALNDDKGTASGSAYIFDVTTGKQLSKLLPSDGRIYDFFGASVTITGNLVVIGVRNDDDNGQDSGSAYVFQQQLPANSLTITPTPLIAKQDGTFTITQARPDQLTWLIYSLDGLQKIFIRQLNVVIDLANPKIAVAPRLTDTNGDLQFILPMPGIQSPLNVWFQAVQHRNVTNFVATQLIP